MIGLFVQDGIGGEWSCCLDLTGYYKLTQPIVWLYVPPDGSQQRVLALTLLEAGMHQGFPDKPDALRLCWLHISPLSAIRLWPNQRTPSATAEYPVRGSPSLQSK